MQAIRNVFTYLAASISALAEIIGTATNRLRQQIELDGDGEAGKRLSRKTPFPCAGTAC